MIDNCVQANSADPDEMLFDTCWHFNFYEQNKFHANFEKSLKSMHFPIDSGPHIPDYYYAHVSQCSITL